jgi:hypothetical protein
MNKTIWKYPLTVTDYQTIEIPINAKLLCVHTQFDIPCLWAEVDSDNRKIKEVIRMFETGQSIDDDVLKDCTYLGTFLIKEDQLVFHVYYEN